VTAERNEADDMSSRESLGRARAAAQSIYDDPDAPVAYEPQGAAECREAVTALSERFAAAVRRRACSSRQQAHVPAEDRARAARTAGFAVMPTAVLRHLAARAHHRITAVSRPGDCDR